MGILEEVMQKKQSENMELNFYLNEQAGKTLTWGNDEPWAVERADYGIAYDERLAVLFEKEGIKPNQTIDELIKETQKNDEILDALVLTQNGIEYTVDIRYENLNIPGIGASSDIWLDFNTLDVLPPQA